MALSKLCYIANMRFPTERAHGIQVASMCSAFAKQGVAVTLLVPNRKTSIEDPFLYYGVPRNFTIEKVPVPDIVRFGKTGFFVESFTFAWRATRRAKKEPNAAVYTREEWPLFFLSRDVAFYEAHQLRRSFVFSWLIKRAKGIVSITQGLKNALVEAGLSEQRILVAHDGYDEEQFTERVSRAEARERLGLPQDRKIAMYVGGLEKWKGSQTLLAASEELRKCGIEVAMIGGTEKELRGLRKRYPEVNFIGARPYRELSVNQQAADVLIVPSSKETKLGSLFTSPLKLFAHMASGVPLVVADVPALREVVGGAEAFMFSPDSPQSLAETIKKALSSERLPEGRAKAAEAEKRVREFTWDKRAKKLLAYMQGCLNEKKSA